MRSSSRGEGSSSSSMLEEIRGKIRRLGIKPAFLRRLGPYVTKEELESIYQKNESVTRIFLEYAAFLCVFKKNETSRQPPAPTSDNYDKTPLANGPTHPPRSHPCLPLLALFVLLGFRLGIRTSARASSSHTRRGSWQARWRERRRKRGCERRGEWRRMCSVNIT